MPITSLEIKDKTFGTLGIKKGRGVNAVNNFNFIFVTDHFMRR